MTRKPSLLGGAVTLVVVVVVACLFEMSTTKPSTSSAREPMAKTTKVERRDLSAKVSLNGTLTYRAGADGSPYAVINQSQGTYTELPAPGHVVAEGQVLYRVNDSPVALLYGSTPAYRTLSQGATGADVAELNADLVALGYATPSPIDQSPASFEWATATALKNLQGALGLPESGTLSLGQALFEPSAVRVTSLSVPLGSSAQSGQTAMQATSTTRQVEVALDASHQSDVAVGNKVTITLPNNQTTPGVVSSVGAVASCPSSSASGGQNSSSTTSGSGTCPSGGSGSGTAPTIAVDVTPSDPAATGTWDQAPVQLTITTTGVRGALVVPVTALLAKAGSGYAVELVGPNGTHHLVAVSLGMFDDADGLVQITGSKLAAGQEVVVPTA
jgi:hypothetical protein